MTTNKAGHTPGPWRIERYNYPGSQRITIEDWTPDGIKSQVARLVKRDAWEANAHLIAAAPDMREALTRIQAMMENWAANAVTEKEMEEALEVAHIAAAALKTARGGPQ